ncbi:MAG: capsular biosynthesis protein [Alphaproteobacteria bacterium]|uniref:Capsular biosynthesis protein n=1 Tax=Brevundimonas mediterranea TaxID=74329 RepID=A0A7Z8Y4G4_9CAUL|nr:MULTISPECIES: capsular biosynthesis protein [Brevundimonas]MBU1272805.1 capsular biosynthesis protein [Alphaproteobacteria bacterium]MBJ7320457.1 capsular biosynthesis protein [Brevundimonas sp.]MBU1519913.1 capsular biosynthesis protein [Alphaproteobacteria bacterium]MBU2030956.1 capsular biosynthesis protein [Alphaproteobacteria bacterium]MBU2163599.1 capsular biosynthesis protein [Alphaproteobacteria bacterium]
MTILPVGSRHRSQSLAGRRFLIVSAPFGGFGVALARTLEARGATVQRMIFNAGDALNWRRAGGVVFKAAAEVWAERLAEVAADFTDLLLFGEGGPYNRAVLSATEGLDARVWVLENGYFRPDWITVELNGVNASSGLPRFRDGYPAPEPVLPDPIPVGRILPHHVVNITAYHLVQTLGAFLFPRHANHYTASPLSQCLGHVRRYLGLAARRASENDVDVIAARGEFFIVCLQREGDAQLLRYSQYADNTAFLAKVMTSFAAHAPRNARLVVKNHPLDPGLIDLAAVTRRLVIERGLQGRVDFIDGGNLAQLCRASQGMVVNNSSAALSALGFHTPVKVLGDAFFDFEGLTDQQALDDFWSAPQAPDTALFTRFRAHVIAQSQVNGNFHEPRAIGRTAHGVADMFERIF